MDKMIELILSALVLAFLAGCSSSNASDNGSNVSSSIIGISNKIGVGTTNGIRSNRKGDALNYNTFAYFPPFPRGDAQIITEDYVKRYDYPTLTPYLILLSSNNFINSRSEHCAYLDSNFHKIISDRLAACAAATYRIEGIIHHKILQLGLSFKGFSSNENRFEAIYGFFKGDNKLGNATNIVKVVDYGGDLREQIKAYKQTLEGQEFVCLANRYCSKQQSDLTYYWDIDRVGKNSAQMTWTVQNGKR